MMLFRTLSFLYFLSVWYLIGASPVPSNTEPPTIETNTGRVKGSVDTTLLDKRIFYSFRAIPYAKPPVGLLRFKVN